MEPGEGPREAVAVELFGGLNVACWPSVRSSHMPKQVWLIVALSLSPDHRLADSQLERLLFRQESTSMYDLNARLRQLAGKARRQLGSQEAIVRVLGAYVLNPRFVQIDFLQFEAAAEEALQSSDPDLIRKAAKLYRAKGRLLSGFQFPTGAAHPHLHEVEDRLREKHQALLDALGPLPPSEPTKDGARDSSRTPVRGLQPKETPRPAARESPQRLPAWAQACLLASAALSLGLAVGVWDPLKMPERQAQRFLEECGRRMQRLYVNMTVEFGSGNIPYPPRTGTLPHECKWLADPVKYDACCVRSRSPFSYNESLCGMRVETIPSRPKTIVLYEGRKGELDFRHEGGKCVLLTLDGKVHVVDREMARDFLWSPPKP